MTEGKKMPWDKNPHIGKPVIMTADLIDGVIDTIINGEFPPECYEADKLFDNQDCDQTGEL